MFNNQHNTIKEAFNKVKQDIFYLYSEIENIKKELFEIKGFLRQINNELIKLKSNKKNNQIGINKSYSALNGILKSYNFKNFYSPRNKNSFNYRKKE